MNNSTEQIFLVNSPGNQSVTGPLKISENTTSQVDLENVENFSNVCRTCATITEFVIPIFMGEGLQNNLAEKIHKHLPIQVSEQDVLPRVVCYQCASTLLAWHELVQCCVQADKALKTRLAVMQHKQKSSKHEAGENLHKESQAKWTPSRVNYDAYLSRVEAKTELKNNTIKVQNFNAVSAVNETVEMDDRSDDDQPLATIATKKSTDLYKKFYDALVSFRNHFITEHKETKCEYPDFTDSSDSEEIIDDQSEDGDKNVNKFDDLTKCNMRIDKMNDETRLELNEVQRKINGKVFFTCKICDKNLSSAHTYIFHKRIHTGERPCVCHICGKQFRAPNGLQRHLTETHERLRRYACSFCPKNFANTQNLKQHIRIHTGERPFVCTHCGKRFTQSGSLHVHLKTHSEQFPFHCAECGAKFRLRAGLTRHRLKHSGERPHVCVQCGKGFRHKHDLYSHALSHTDPKPHTCSVCNAAFRQKRALKHHYKRVHENEPPREVVNHLIFNNLGQYQ